MEDIQHIIKDAIGYAIALVSGIFATIVTTKWLNKEIILTKRFFVQRTAAASNSNYWGKIDVLYNGNPCNNLHFITVEIRNESNKNIEDVEVRFTVLENNSIYANSGRYKQDEIFTQLKLADGYFAYFMDVVERNKIRDTLDELGKERLQTEIDIVVREKTYHMPVLNKRGMGVFSFLIDNSTAVEPTLNVSIIKKDIRLALYQEEEERKEAQTKWVSIITLFLLLGFSCGIFKFSPSVLLAVTAMIVNVFFAYYLGLFLYKCVLWFKAYIA